MAVSLSVSMYWPVVNQNVNNVGPQASDFLVCDWLMMLMMSSTNGGFERRKVRLVLVDEFLSVYNQITQPEFLGLRWIVPQYQRRDIVSFIVILRQPAAVYPGTTEEFRRRLGQESEKEQSHIVRNGMAEKEGRLLLLALISEGRGKDSCWTEGDFWWWWDVFFARLLKFV